MKDFQLLNQEVKKIFKWYMFHENIDDSYPSKECVGVVSHFLQYWFNDGIDGMASNQSQWFGEETDTNGWILYRKIRFDCINAIKYIISNYSVLCTYGFINPKGNSIFGLKLWDNTTSLKEEIIKFAKIENVPNIPNLN